VGHSGTALLPSAPVRHHCSLAVDFPLIISLVVVTCVVRELVAAGLS